MPAAQALHVPFITDQTVTFQGDDYRAWWNFTDFPNIDPFRFLCGEPCPLGTFYVSGHYAGFRQAHAELLQVTGIDVLNDSKPVDLHLTGAHFCGPWNANDGQAGWSARHSDGSLMCLWTWDKADAGDSPPLSHDQASEVDSQRLEIHEYAHIIFYGRHRASYEDVVIPLSFLITAPAEFHDPCYERYDSNGRGRLIYELCQLNGFAWSDLAPALTAMDALYQSGGGYGYSGAPTAVFQWRRILDDHFGESTQDAFRAAHMPPPAVGDEWGVTHEGGDFLVAGGAALLQMPRDAVSAPMALRFVEAAVPSSVSDLPGEAGNNTTVELGPDLAPHWQPRYQILFEPTRLTYKYGDYDLPDGIQEPRMDLRSLDFAGDWQTTGDSFADLEDGTITGVIDGLGTHAMAGPRGASDKLPARVVPLVIDGDDFGEHWQTSMSLNNPSRERSEGRLVFRANGKVGTGADPTFSFSLNRRETLSFADLADEFGVSDIGSGSVDVYVDSGHAPEIDTRVFSLDDGYTHGGAVDDRKPGLSLRPGEAGVLLLPGSFESHAFHVGVRTFSSQTSLKITVYDRDGNREGRVIKTFDPSFTSRQTVQQLVERRPPSRFIPPELWPGIVLEGGESLFIETLSGEALVYGDTINLRGDMDMQYARPLGRTNLSIMPLTLMPSTNALEREAFPVNVRSWETSLRLHNPTDATISGELVLRTITDVETGDTEALTANYSIAPHASHFIADVPAYFAICAIGHPCPVMQRQGSLEIVPDAGPAPMALARVSRTLFGFEGAGFQQESVSPFAPMQSGEISVIMTPQPPLERSLGIRTFDEGVTLLLTEDSTWIHRPRIRHEIGPDQVREIRIDDLMGDAYEPEESVRLRVEAGRALLWIVERDPLSGDSAYYPLRRYMRPL